MKLACLALLFTCFLIQTLLLGQDKVRNLTPGYKTTKDSFPVNNTIKGKYHIKIYYNFNLVSGFKVMYKIKNDRINFFTIFCGFLIFFYICLH